ncbi:hypothetical protein [Lutibacter flavus]|uniref:Uncharacterized protein n=1 Tax=Lutibacter flavus TaxID=691689 RepID=A0A238ZCA5_9FLAO|nr:hypothetical protein [Lutibacter flavus]SNR81156.1 hypothetical protein SAMN04488111_3241 [Lutibacter flavus]
MNSLQLKNKIIERIIEIDDDDLLKSIDALFNGSDKNILSFLVLANDKFQQENETSNFTEYIKEWVKSM